MTQPNPPNTSIDPPEGSPAPRSQHGARQLAEWVSFGVSALLVLALAAHLVYDGFRANGPIVHVEVIVAIDDAAAADGRHVVPVHVHNKGPRTLPDVKVEVTHQRSDGEKGSHEFDIDYLPEGSHETLYFYVDREPRDANIEAKAVHYRLE